MNEKLYNQIRKEVVTRTEWVDRQDAWYRMRYKGIKRSKKPYPNAPDMHYPLIDSMIDKLKPFYIGQLYGRERLASFISGKPQDSNLTGLAEKLFDEIVKQKTNFEHALFVAIDYMCVYGRGPIKIRWDANRNKIVFSPIRPIHIIVPSWTENLSDADWLVHVMHLSEEQYKRNDNFKQDETYIKSLKGQGTDGISSESQEDDILLVEGITTGQNKDQIVIWECYYRDGNDIRVDTISPLVGEKDPIRPCIGLPYTHGQIPFADLKYEITDVDYYQSRGISEILSHFEMDLNKLWNHKLQFLDFFGQPNYKNTSGAVNTTNFKNNPGAILPQGIEPIVAPSAPMDFQQEMQNQRAIAEDRITVPTLSAPPNLSGRNKSGRERTTAAEIKAIVGESNISQDMRARVFRLQLSTVYSQAWSLICQYMPQDQQVLENFTQVPPQVMHDSYRIRPSGSADNMSKEMRVARALGYYQLFISNPFIGKPELTKWVLSEDDSNLVKQLYKEPMQEQMDEAEKQNNELLMMMAEMAVPVHESDDPKIHLVTTAGWVQKQLTMGRPIAPPTAGRILQHSLGHAQQIEQRKDKQGMALLNELKPGFAMLQQIAQGGQPQLPQGPARPQLPQGSPQGPPQAAPAPQGQQQSPETTVQLRIPPPVIDLSQLKIPAPIVNIPKPPPVVVNVPPAQVHVPAPVVHVPAPVVNVEAAQEAKGKKTITVKRDKEGKITGAEVK